MSKDNIINNIDNTMKITNDTKSYWNNKPIFQSDKNPNSEPIDYTFMNLSLFDKEIKLPINQFDWLILDIESSNMEQLTKIADFLNIHYTYKSDSNFSTVYTPEYLLWLGNKEHFGGKFVCIVNKSNKDIYATICVLYKNMTVYDKNEKFGYVDFMCVHPIYRHKKLNVILMDKITQMITTDKINQGLFLTNKKISSQIVSVIRTYKRPINYIKLAESDFAKINVNKNNTELQDSFNIIYEPKHRIEKMTKIHLNDIYYLLKTYLTRFNVHQNYDISQLEAMLLNNPVVNSYVFYDESNKVIDFISYYKLDLKNSYNLSIIREANLFIHSCNNISVYDLLNNFLYIGSRDGFDLVGVNDAMFIGNELLTTEYNNDTCSDTESYSKVYEFKFLKSNKKYMYLYNWRMPLIKSNKQLYIFD